MTLFLIQCIALTFISSFLTHFAGIRLAFRWGILDKPTLRKRHTEPIPIVGGACIFLAWSVGLTTYCLLDPAWLTEYWRSLAATGGSLGILIILGFIDDIRGLGPYVKLFFQGLAACLVLAFEPHIQAFCLLWQNTVGYAIWPLAAVWIVGVTNAMNLIDGLDGLAGGNALLACTSVLLLCIWSDPQARFAMVIIGCLIPAILVFLKYNWFPARIFLGDNGSLPLGFLISVTSLMCHPQNKTWIMFASIVLMLGYPLLDTSLAVVRRFGKKLPLFKADRNHLHFRMLRLGLSYRDSAAILLSIGLYLQIAAICINLMSPASAALGLSVVGFSIFTLIFLVRGIEQWRIFRLFKALERTKGRSVRNTSLKKQQIMNIDLEPLLESGMLEERERYGLVTNALCVMLQAHIRRDDVLLLTKDKISIVFGEFDGNPEIRTILQEKFRDKIQSFLTLFNIQCSFSGMSITFEEKNLLIMGPPDSTHSSQDFDRIEKAA